MNEGMYVRALAEYLPAQDREVEAAQGILDHDFANFLSVPIRGLRGLFAGTAPSAVVAASPGRVDWIAGRRCADRMKSHSHIVDGGGWITRQAVGRPRARFFGFLSILWLGVSLGASFPFWDGWPESFGYWEWLCSALLVPQPVFVVAAVVFLLTERPRTITETRPIPDHDIRKLY